MAKIRMAQYGTKHGHARGKLQAMFVNPDVEVAGVFEPDAQQRQKLQANGGTFADVHWFADAAEMLDDETIVANCFRREQCREFGSNGADCKRW